MVCILGLFSLATVLATFQKIGRIFSNHLVPLLNVWQVELIEIAELIDLYLVVLKSYKLDNKLELLLSTSDFCTRSLLAGLIFAKLIIGQFLFS
jgi:hypothetical protein